MFKKFLTLVMVFVLASGLGSVQVHAGGFTVRTILPMEGESPLPGFTIYTSNDFGPPWLFEKNDSGDIIVTNEEVGSRRFTIASPVESEQANEQPYPLSTDSDEFLTGTFSALTFLQWLPYYILDTVSITYDDTDFPLGSDMFSWFENAEVKTIKLPEESHFYIAVREEAKPGDPEAGVVFPMSEDSYFEFTLNVDGEELLLEIGFGRKAAFVNTEDGYKVLPLETAALQQEQMGQPNETQSGNQVLSETPPEPEQTAAASALSDWCGNISWDGNAVTFTAKQDAVVVGVSLWVDGTEYKAGNISNASGNMGSTNGATFRPGSSLLLDGKKIVVFEGTTVSCEADVSGAPDKITIYLDSGEELSGDLD
jgi:hypothetical protein